MGTLGNGGYDQLLAGLNLLLILSLNVPVTHASSLNPTLEPNPTLASSVWRILIPTHPKARRGNEGEVIIARSEHPSQLLQQGRSLYQSGQFTQAITAWQQAAQAYQAASDTLNHALTLSYLALASQQLGQWAEARTKIEQAISLLNRQAQPSKERLLVLAQVLNTQGSFQFAQGQTETALATWQRAAMIYAQVGNDLQRVGNLINQAQAQQSLGLFLRARRTLDEVNQQLQQQPNSSIKATGLRSLGNVLIMTGQVAAAQRALQQSLKIADQISSPADQSAALLSLGNLARIQNDRVAAIAFSEPPKLATHH